MIRKTTYLLPTASSLEAMSLSAFNLLQQQLFIMTNNGSPLSGGSVACEMRSIVTASLIASNNMQDII